MVSIRKRKHLFGSSERCKVAHPSKLARHETSSEQNVVAATTTVYRPEVVRANPENKPTMLQDLIKTFPVAGATSIQTPRPPFQEKELKRRKMHRRKQVDNQEPCMLRGVYFKNLKWQAAIKVGKKQVHLGTVSTQEEAAHLYDRAAYMCGREPNFELSEEEKHELQSFEWEEFLALTRKAIAHKKMQNKLEAQMRRRQAAIALKTTPVPP